MSESIQSRLLRWRFNLFPSFRRSGGTITYISHDLKQVRIRLPLNWKTRNLVGTIYGGSMYAAIDPVYMAMLMKLLGSDYIIWDKAAAIRYLKPGRTTLHAAFNVGDEELSLIRNKLAQAEKLDRTYQIELMDAQSQVTAVIDKTLQIRKRSNAVAT